MQSRTFFLHPPTLIAAVAALAAGAAAQAEPVVGLTTTNALVTFDSTSPLNATAPVAITGLLGANEQILGIDLRPANGTIVGLGSSGRLYTLNAGTGAATFLSALSGATLAGSSYGVDFNPTVDRLRVTSSSGQNLRINVDTGAVTVDGAISGATTSVSGSAYTNSFPGSTATTLYDISAATDTLYVQNPPNNGTLVAVGALGVNTSGVAGFDISGASGVGYAALLDADTDKSSFYTISLTTGAATLVGAIGYGGNTAIAAPLLGLTVAAVPEPATYATFGAGLLALAAVARRRRASRAG